MCNDSTKKQNLNLSGEKNGVSWRVTGIEYEPKTYSVIIHIIAKDSTLQDLPIDLSDLALIIDKELMTQDNRISELEGILEQWLNWHKMKIKAEMIGKNALYPPPLVETEQALKS